MKKRVVYHDSENCEISDGEAVELLTAGVIRVNSGDVEVTPEVAEVEEVYVFNSVTSWEEFEEARSRMKPKPNGNDPLKRKKRPHATLEGTVEHAEAFGTLKGVHAQMLLDKLRDRCKRLPKLIELNAPEQTVRKEARMIFEALLAYFGPEVLLSGLRDYVTHSMGPSAPVMQAKVPSYVRVDYNYRDTAGVVCRQHTLLQPEAVQAYGLEAAFERETCEPASCIVSHELVEGENVAQSEFGAG